MNKNVRTGVWNAVLSKLFSQVTVSREGMVAQDFYIFISLWKHFFKLPLDEFERDVSERKAWYRDQLETFSEKDLLSFVEFVAAKLTQPAASNWVLEVNQVFESENIKLLGSRFVALETNRAASEVQNALSLLNLHADTMAEVEVAFQKAVDCIANRKPEDVDTTAATIALFEVEKILESGFFKDVQSSLRVLAATGLKNLSDLQAALGTDKPSLQELNFLFGHIALRVELLVEHAIAQKKLSPRERVELTSSINLWGEKK